MGGKAAGVAGAGAAAAHLALLRQEEAGWEEVPRFFTPHVADRGAEAPLGRHDGARGGDVVDEASGLQRGVEPALFQADALGKPRTKLGVWAADPQEVPLVRIRHQGAGRGGRNALAHLALKIDARLLADLVGTPTGVALREVVKQ